MLHVFIYSCSSHLLDLGWTRAHATVPPAVGFQFSLFLHICCSHASAHPFHLPISSDLNLGQNHTPLREFNSVEKEWNALPALANLPLVNRILILIAHAQP